MSYKPLDRITRGFIASVGKGVCPRPRVLRGRGRRAWRLEREAREDDRRRRGERLPPESAVRVFVCMAARAAFDFAARERFAAFLRAHALVLAAVPVVMVVLAHVPAWISEFRPFVLNSRVDLHAIGATPVRWRGDVGSSIRAR